MASVLILLAAAATLGGFVLGPFSEAMAATMPGYPISAIGIVEALQEIGTSVLVTVPVALAILSIALVRSFARSRPKPLSNESPIARLSRSGVTIDGMYTRFAGIISTLATRVRRTQTGDLNLNLLGLMGALVVIVAVLLWGWVR